MIAAVALTGGSSTADGRHAYLQANICGNVCNQGGLAVVRNLVRTITGARPFAVTLNEVCENQYDRLRADLPVFRGRFDPTGPRCANGSRYGNALLVRAPDPALIGSWQLPNPGGGEARRLMCLGTRVRGAAPVVACVTHVSPVPADTTAQIDAVARILGGLAGTGAVLLGGDFNADPADARMDQLYRTCRGASSGTFAEADSAGAAECDGRTPDRRRGFDVRNEGTFPVRAGAVPRQKLDYIFLSAGHWSDVHARAVDAANGLSDHYALWATASFRG
jgi:endonuclease/exonuclease/phosphatase family metal-dependent hydrolase